MSEVDAAKTFFALVGAVCGIIIGFVAATYRFESAVEKCAKLGHVWPPQWCSRCHVDRHVVEGTQAPEGGDGG